MTHTPITDAMVERACAAGNNGTGREIMRVMLEAALNPPPEPPPKPEIPVSEAMIKAAIAEWNIGNMKSCKYTTSEAFLAGAYRAMERVRRAELPPSFGDSAVTRPEYVQEQREKNAQWRRDLDNAALRPFTICPECGVGSYHGQPSHMPNCSHAHLLFP